MKIPNIKEYNGLPVVTSEKMKYIDRLATLDYSISSQTLMENAGKACANEVANYVKEKFNNFEINISVLCGRGHNGGDGLVCARYLKDLGFNNVKIFIINPSDRGYPELVVKNLNKAKEKSIDINLCTLRNITEIESKLNEADIIIDALLGISAVGKPVAVVKKMIQIANRTKKDIIAIDIPSGLNPDTGHHTGVFIKAVLTLTMGLPKSGLMAACAQKNIGILKVIDIGYPQALIERIKKN
ncbi:MAG: NAD(P)H-hydrate epimerase [Elusimicrobiota bacterium]